MHSKKHKGKIPVALLITAGTLAAIAAVIILFVTPGFLIKPDTEETAGVSKEQTAVQEIEEDSHEDINKTGAKTSDNKEETGAETGNKEEEADGSKYLYFTLLQNEEVLADKNSVKVTVKELYADSESGDLYLKLSIDNGTDKKINILSGDGYVNGLLADIELDAGVGPKETKEEAVIFKSYSIRKYNLERIGELEFDFSVTDTDSGEELFKSEHAGIKTDLYGTFEQKYPDFGDLGVLKINSDDEETAGGISVNFIGYYPEDELIPQKAAMVFYIRNNTENDYCFYSSNIDINKKESAGYVKNTLWASHQGMLMFRIDDTEGDKTEDIELGIGIYKDGDENSGIKVGDFSVIYNPDMEKPEETAKKFSTQDAPTDDDFIYFCRVFDELADKRKINYDHEAYSGGYKAFIMIYDDAGKDVRTIKYLRAGIKSADDSIRVTLYPVSEYDVKTDKTKDLSKEDDLEFVGKWNADDDFTATATGNDIIDMAIVSTEEGQYALGDYTYPDGTKAEIGFMRP